MLGKAGRQARCTLHTAHGMLLMLSMPPATTIEWLPTMIDCRQQLHRGGRVTSTERRGASRSSNKQPFTTRQQPNTPPAARAPPSAHLRPQHDCFQACTIQPANKIC